MGSTRSSESTGMVIVFSCPDCGRGYSRSRFLGDRDANGARPVQCPNCYALLGHTGQDETRAGP
ncbi:hypothetical protein ACFQJD_18945 [Haloplanus sp. GCM10025708]|uniref:hypothetical protein n=2 Tax=Haloferacaceae TaxID=1644056 RepID=UPI003620CF59